MNKIVFILFLSITAFSQAQLETYSFEQIEILQVSNPKPVVIFIHADWCKICKLMEKTTLQNKTVIDKLSTNFYFVKFDAEQTGNILFNKHEFKYQATGPTTGVHELAEILGSIDGKLAFPTTSILNEKNELIFQYNKSLTASELVTVLDKIVALK